jgi:hypothetical protein
MDRMPHRSEVANPEPTDGANDCVLLNSGADKTGQPRRAWLGPPFVRSARVGLWRLLHCFELECGSLAARWAAARMGAPD